MTGGLQNLSRNGERRLRVVFCANPGYFQHVAVAAVSLVENNRDSAIEIHLLTCEPDAAAEKNVQASLAQYHKVNLIVYHVSDRRIHNLFVDKHVSKETYLRILAPELIPSHIDRIIYLDSDLIVVDDLQQFWNMNLGSAVLAAAPDHFAQERRVSLGMSEDHAYVNAGVLLVDVEAWRRLGLTQRLLTYIDRHGTALQLHDQDAINAVLQGAICVVDRRWNVQTAMFRAVQRCFPEEFAAIREACRRPAIIHFSGPDKPWLFRAQTARKGDYLRYLNKTAWRGARPQLTSSKERTEYWIDRVLSRASIDYLYVLYKLDRARTKLSALIAARLRGALRATTGIVGKAGPS